MALYKWDQTINDLGVCSGLQYSLDELTLFLHGR